MIVSPRTKSMPRLRVVETEGDTDVERVTDVDALGEREADTLGVGDAVWLGDAVVADAEKDARDAVAPDDAEAVALRDRVATSVGGPEGAADALGLPDGETVRVVEMDELPVRVPLGDTDGDDDTERE